MIGERCYDDATESDMSAMRDITRDALRQGFGVFHLPFLWPSGQGRQFDSGY